jgi:hypothetical protein
MHAQALRAAWVCNRLVTTLGRHRVAECNFTYNARMICNRRPPAISPAAMLLLLPVGVALAAPTSQTVSKPASQPTANAPARLTLKGTQILTPDGQPIILRGFNLLWWVPPTAQDVIDIKALGANCVRYQFGYVPDGQFDPRRLRALKRHIELFTSQGLWVIPNVHTFQTADREDAENVWNSPRIQREFLDMWDCILNELKDQPFIAAWEPLNEPHYVDREKLAPWYREVVTHFRAKDAHTPIVVEGANYSGAEELLDSLKLDDANIIYSFHFYHPHEYTHMRRFPGKPLAEYPGEWGKAALAKRMSTAIRFRDRYQAPVYCGEWGARTGAPGYQQWLEDVAGLLEENHLPWTHWAWAVQKRWPINDTFDCNSQKTEIHDLLSGVFKNARAKDQREDAGATKSPPSQGQ